MTNTDRWEETIVLPPSPHPPLLLESCAAHTYGPLRRKVGVPGDRAGSESSYRAQGIIGDTLGSVQTVHIVQLNLFVQTGSLSADRLYPYTAEELV